MKTISPPIMPKVEDRVYRIACQNPECQAVFEIAHGELKHEMDQRDGDFSQFTCQYCKRQTSVGSRKLKDFLVPPGPTPRYPIPDR